MHLHKLAHSLAFEKRTSTMKYTISNTVYKTIADYTSAENAVQLKNKLKALENDLLPININITVFRNIDSGDHFHQRRFTRAVFTHQRMNRAAFKLHGNIIKRAHARKFLAYIPDF